MARRYRTIPHLTPQDIERFEKFIDRSPGQGPQGTCHIWKGGCTQDGYGLFGLGRNPNGSMQSRRTARVSYFLKHGVDPVGQIICHACDNPPCVNPAHLFPGDDLINAHDKIKKGRVRLPHGTEHWKCKLNEEKVRKMRKERAQGAKLKEPSLRYDVNCARVSAVCLYRCWKHVQ